MPRDPDDPTRALDVLESLPFVNKGRFAVIGHSLGGHNSIFTALFDERIQCIVSSCGFDSFAEYKRGDLTGWTSQRYMPRLALELELRHVPTARLPLDSLHRGHVLLSAGHSIAVQNFNENISILIMLGLYATLISLDLSIYIVIGLFGAFISGSMFLVRKRHLYNLTQGPLPVIPSGAIH